MTELPPAQGVVWAGTGMAGPHRLFAKKQPIAKTDPNGALEACANALEVDVAGVGVSDAASLAKCRRVTVVDLSRNRLSELFAPPTYRSPLQQAEAGSGGASSEDGDQSPEGGGITRVRLWPALRSLAIAKNGLRTIPETFFPHCYALQHLDLSSNALEDLPASIRSLSLLETLDLSHNRLASLLRLEGLPALRTLVAPHNSIARLNHVPGTLPSLTHLDLSHNPIESLQSLSRCEELQTLELAGSCVRALRQVHFVAGLPVIESLDLRDTPLARGEGDVDTHVYRLRTLFAAPQLCSLDGEAAPASERVKAAVAHGGEVDVAERHHREAIPDVPFTSRQPVLVPSSGEPRLLCRRGVRQGGAYLVLEAWDAEGPNQGLRIVAYIPDSSEKRGEVKVSADTYQEAYDALARAMRGVDAPGDGSDRAPGGDEGPSALQVVESLLTRVRVAFRRGSLHAPPDMWLERITFVRPEPLCAARSVPCAEGEMEIEVTPDGPSSYVVRGSLPAVPETYSLNVPAESAQELIGGDAGLPDLPLERRREVVEGIAERVRVVRRAGKNKLVASATDDGLLL